METMVSTALSTELQKCVRCGTCKTLCPTYHLTCNESFGARGRVVLLGELCSDKLAPNKKLAERIYSCMLCEACKGVCPTGINIPEVIYKGRALLKKSFKKGYISKKALRTAITYMNSTMPFARVFQKLFYRPFSRTFGLRYFPEISSKPFNKNIQVYKNVKKTGRIAIFAGCNVNYFYPHLGYSLSHGLLSRGYEVVVFKGEECCGAPLRSMGLEDEASDMARRNLDHFNRVRADAIISLCPTCTLVIREQYPLIVGDTISNIMDLNEFLIKFDFIHDLEAATGIVTYHDPCHLSHGLGIREQPRKILNSIKGLEYREMKHADECCGFAGLFSMQFKEMANTIGMKKIENISNTSADTVVTSCPGCIMQLESLCRKAHLRINIKHMVEVVDEAMHGH
ncbi:MAG: (Fe-S)-binding protein [Nitrospiraceae bacterium]|nr:MAG: (Fe-S)-binding protein [Nitrospiraceae bacterium]